MLEINNRIVSGNARRCRDNTLYIDMPTMTFTFQFSPTIEYVNASRVENRSNIWSSCQATRLLWFL
jgi:hypothetical protein